MLSSLNAQGLILYLAVQSGNGEDHNDYVLLNSLHHSLQSFSEQLSNSLRQLEQKYVSSSIGHAWLSGGKTADNGTGHCRLDYLPIFFLF